MRRGFVLAIAAAMLSALARAQESAQTKIIPDAHWVKIYFDSVDRLTARMKMKPLRTARLGADDIELRVWEGFGLGPLTGYVMKRSAGKWSARASRQRSKNSADTLKVPTATDWASVWGQLQQAGLSNIRDHSDNPTCAIVLDGVGYVVEIAQGNSYRTYLVSNPQAARTEDGDRFLALLPVLLEAFGQKSWVDVASLPTREIQTVTSVVAEKPATLVTPTPWKSESGQSVNAVAEVALSSEQALAQAVNLRTPTCSELPVVLRRLGFSGEAGDVAVEVLIDPSGGVRGVRAL